MKLTTEAKHYLDQSVLCWLATSSDDGSPNVSPKEIFTYFDEDEIIVANIASPQTVQNIHANPKVCLSCLDILVQKGVQLKGTARILTGKNEGYAERTEKLETMTGGKFPFSSITSIRVESHKQILAPSYIFFPKQTTEASQIEGAKKQYGLDERL